MTGSLQIKRGFYFIVLNTYDANGKRKQKWISTGLTEKGNKKRAEKMLQEKLRENEKTEKLVRTEMLFSDAVRYWLNDVEIRVDAVTLQGYEALARCIYFPILTR